jgi:hypothetical protein
MQLILPETYSFSSTLKFEAVISTEKSVTNYLSTWRPISFINKSVRTTKRTLFWKLKYPLQFISYVRCHGIIYHEITRRVSHVLGPNDFQYICCQKKVIFPVQNLFEQCSCLTALLEYLLADTNSAVEKQLMQNPFP